MIRAMTPSDLDLVLGWAADEGWNPGKSDARAFLAADPGGFLVKDVAGAPVAAISVVNHSPEFAFLGLYIVRPGHRGQGHGIALWRAGLARAGARTVGLDGVPAQLENYGKFGFVRTGRTIRYAGPIQGDYVHDARPFEASDLKPVLKADALASGVSRPAYLSAWLRGDRHRSTVVLELPRRELGFATVRQCQTGVKIGPLHAPDRATAVTLLMACASPEQPQQVAIDIPEDCDEMIALAEDLGMAPVFETARMYLGPAPQAAPPPYYSIATMELG